MVKKFRIKPLKIIDVKVIQASKSKPKYNVRTDKKPKYKVPQFAKIPFTGFGSTKQPIPKKPNKNLTYPQANKQYMISPYGDYDRDSRLNVFDCRPFDATKHKVPEEHKDKPVMSHIKPNIQFKDVFAEAEQKLPKIFKSGGRAEEEYSEKLSDALLKRKETKKTPFKSVVGIHKIEVPMAMGETQLVHHYLGQYFEHIYPEKEFVFDLSKPKLVTVIDYEVTNELKNAISGKTYRKGYNQLTPEERSNVDSVAVNESKKGVVKNDVKISSLLDKAPQHVKGLLTHLSPFKSVTVYISDNPVDILMKSTEQGWTSCERIGGEYEEGIFSDIEHCNAIAYVYFGDKKPGVDKPSGRVMLRWGLREDGKTQDIGMEDRMYGVKDEDSNNIMNEIRRLLASKGFATHVVRTPYHYEGYSDTYSGHPTGSITYRPIPVTEAKTIVGDIHKLKYKLVEKPKVPKPFIPFLVHETEEPIRHIVSGIEELPPKHIRTLSRDYSSIIRTRIASRKDIEEPLIRQLAKDTSSDVKSALLNKELPEDVQMELIKDDMVARRIAANPNTSDKILKLLIKEKGVYVWQQVAMRPNLPKELIDLLIKKYDETITTTLIDYQTLSHDTLLQLSNSNSRTIREHLVEKVLTEEIMLNLLKKGIGSNAMDVLANCSWVTPKVALVIAEKADEQTIKQLLNNSILIDKLNSKEKVNLFTKIWDRGIARGKLTSMFDLPDELIKKVIEEKSNAYIHNLITFSRTGHEYNTIFETLLKTYEKEPVMLREHLDSLYYNMGSDTRLTPIGQEIKKELDKLNAQAKSVLIEEPEPEPDVVEYGGDYVPGFDTIEKANEYVKQLQARHVNAHVAKFKNYWVVIA